ncbi:MAG: TatD family hydrolase [candidate division KSB1 bacterium]|nr:TatD family hydrolase [candidate division KSB1 bacterium]MDZ7319132.1 TatD family hydrolase [candidate division KSB1 bacterium]MDZ7341795.1 TatD family hydrolase [candidate division KSB1 bacterium]
MEPKFANSTFVDSHAHLDFADFDGDRDVVIQNARAARIAAIINIGIDLATSRKAIELAQNYDLVYATVGIHPHEAAAVPKHQWSKLIALYQQPKVVAIGEIGLDFYRDYAPHDMQVTVFRQQLELAIEHHLPVIVHTRNAWSEILPIMTNEYRGRLQGVFHCFSGSEEHARQLLDAGYYISFTGVVTFKNAQALRIAADYVPLDRLLLETDCPFMAPVPYRGKRCEPAHIPYIAQKIAEAKRITLAELAEKTNRNVESLFGIKLNGIGQER